MNDLGYRISMGIAFFALAYYLTHIAIYFITKGDTPPLP